MILSPKPRFGARLNRRHDLTRGLVGLWLFNEDGGEAVNDLTRNSQPGELHANSGRFKWGGGVMGTGLVGVGGEYDRVTIPDGAHLTFSVGDRISLSAWIKRDTESFTVPIAAKDAPSGRRNWFFGLSNSNALGFSYHSSGGTEQRWDTGSGITGMLLRHLAFDYVYGTAGSIVAYVDGANAGSSGWSSGDGNATPDSGAGAAYLGFDSLLGGGANGWLFQIALWKNRAGGLTQQDAQLLFTDPYAVVQRRRRSRTGLAGASAALTGTALDDITEADVVAGNKTIIITLSGDTFIPA